MGVYKRKNPEPPKCQYNDGVVCWLTEKKCDRCGWCPDVEQRRNDNIRAKLGKGWKL